MYFVAIRLVLSDQVTYSIAFVFLADINDDFVTKTTPIHFMDGKCLYVNWKAIETV